MNESNHAISSELDQSFHKQNQFNHDEVAKRLWASLPHELPSNPTDLSTHDIEQIDKLPSTFRMYCALLFKRKPGLKRGESLPLLVAETTLTLDLNWLTRYRKICAWPSTTDTTILPITVPQVFAAPLQTYLLSHPKFPLSSLGVVHAANEMIAIEPIDAQTPLSLRVWIGETRWRERGLEFDLHTVARKVGTDEAIWLAKTTVFRSIKDTQSSSKSNEKRSEKPAELTLSAESQTLPLSADLGRRYAPIAGDRNPIHLYPITAKLFGFKRPIVHGMWTLARALSGYATQLSPDQASLSVGRLSVKFRRPLFLPSTANLLMTPYQSEETSSQERGEFQELGVCLQVLDTQNKVAIEGAMCLNPPHQH